MEQKLIISVDSTADLSPELCARFDIRVVPVTVTLGEDSFPDTPDFSPEMIYARYRKDGTLPQTASPSLQTLTDYFSTFTAQGYQVVHLDVSAELSGTCGAARIAAAELDGVYVVDSRSLCQGIALLAIQAAQYRDEGMTAPEIVARLETLRDKVDTSFVLDSLEFMRKGGRCSGIAALGANLLKLKPALEMADGKLRVYKKYRGPDRTVLRSYVRERLAGKTVRPGVVILSHSGEADSAIMDELDALVRELCPGAEIIHGLAGCTICSHCGPKTVAVFFINE